MSSIRSVAFYSGHFLFMVCLLYAISSDAGSCLVYVAIFVCMTFAAGVKLRWFVLGGAGVTGAFLLAWFQGWIPSYMQQRIEVILDHSLYPMGAGWHQGRSIIAMARRPNRTAAAFRPGTRTLFFQLPAKNWATLAVLLLLCFWWRSSFAAWWWPGRLKRLWVR